MKLLKKVIATAALSMAAMSATSASATTLLFSYSPTFDPAGAFSFKVDDHPEASGSMADRFTVQIANGTGQYSGVTSTKFYTLISLGGLGSYVGPQLFSGTTSAPVLSTGTFGLAKLSGVGAGILTITAVAGAVPEPATWAMMILGMGLVGFAMRTARRRSDTRFDARIKRIATGELA